MRRAVTLITAFFATAIAGSGALAQQVSGLPRVGLLFLGSQEQSRGSAEFREGMRSLGWTDGSNFSFEYRFANGDPERLFADAVLAAAKVDVIVAFGPLASRAARHATAMIPIVGATVDPGLIASLARPGGNVTGLTLMMQDITAKQLQLLKESMPGISKVGVLLHPDTPGLAQLMAELERAAARIGVAVPPVVVGTVQDLPRRFNEITAAGADA